MSKKSQSGADMMKRRYKRMIIGWIAALIVLIAALALYYFRDDIFSKDFPSPDFSGEYPVATIIMENGGEIVIELYPDKAPNTVANFIELANSGYYDGLTFHRVMENFMIQGGDPYGDGRGGPGYNIAGEFAANNYPYNDIAHTRGVISMARGKENDTAGSQFFIMHADAPHLDGLYAAFGRVISGMEVVDEIAVTRVDIKDKPIYDIVMKSVSVETHGVEYVSEKIK